MVLFTAALLVVLLSGCSCPALCETRCIVGSCLLAGCATALSEAAAQVFVHIDLG